MERQQQQQLCLKPIYSHTQSDLQSTTIENIVYKLKKKRIQVEN